MYAWSIKNHHCTTFLCAAFFFSLLPPATFVFVVLCESDREIYLFNMLLSDLAFPHFSPLWSRPIYSLIKLPVTGKVHLRQKVWKVSVRYDAYGETAIRNCLREHHTNIDLEIELIRKQLIPVKGKIEEEKYLLLMSRVRLNVVVFALSCVVIWNCDDFFR